MEAVRKIYHQLPDVLKMPKRLQQYRVEVILLPLEEATSVRRPTKNKISPLARFAGAWTGEMLVREEHA
ncbi:MAG: hypothetical protein JJE30_04335 [Desulfuromonadales bacterium]|nr:hypothetical protein [Desulfuromonadales bacterium]